MKLSSLPDCSYCAIIVFAGLLGACSSLTLEPPNEKMDQFCIKRFRGKDIECNNEAVFCFYELGELNKVSKFLKEFQIQVDPRSLIGTFPCGDIVVERYSGLSVIGHDSMEEWESGISIRDFLRHLKSSTIELEEWFYGNGK